MRTTTTQVCRSCQGTLDPFLDLGEIQLSGYLAPDEDARPTAPLVLSACADCRLVQLLHTAPRELLFTHYWYRSGVNEVMRAELADVVAEASARVDLEAGDTVIDTGANDGTLLAQYTEPVHRVAYEPARNLLAQLRPHAETIVPDYFPSNLGALLRLSRRPKIITSIAMFYAVEDIQRFLAAIATVLHEDGVWVVQFQDLANMLSARAFDNVCHEHLMYYSVASFAALLKPHGLAVTRVSERAINGGSVRVVVRHASYVPQPSVAAALQKEAWCQAWSALERFAGDVWEVRRQLQATLAARLRRGQVIDLYGASTKANTLLQVCGLDHSWIRQAWERSPEKVGRRTAGTDIPIVDEAAGRANPPDALLVGIWQFREALLEREAEYLQHGAMIFPLPNVDVVTANREADHVGA